MCDASVQEETLRRAQLLAQRARSLRDRTGLLDQPGEGPVLTQREETEALEALRDVQAVCTKLWNRLEQSQKEFRAPRLSDEPGRNDLPPRLAFLEAKWARARAEAGVLRERISSEVALQDSPVGGRKLAVVSALQREINELQLLAPMLQNELVRAQDEIEWETARADEHKLIDAALQQKIQTAREEAASKTPITEAEEVRRKLGALKTAHGELLRHFRGFLTKFFPRPGIDVQPPPNSTADSPLRWRSLGEIINDLLEAMMRDPENPSVPVQSTWWPPYVELLLRTGIALKDPKDSSRLQCEKFFDERDDVI